MKKIITLAILAFAFASCSPKIYYGTVTHYMPDGEIETHKAYYMPQVNNVVYVDYGNGQTMVTSDIPWKFVGCENKYDEYTGAETITFNYEGKSYDIPKEVWDSIQVLARENGKLNKKKVEEYMSAYVKENLMNTPKFKDGIY